MTISVVLADDHLIVRDGVASLLGREPGIDVVAVVADGEAAVTAARELRPDVVVIDVSMPVLDGIEATERITSALPGVQVMCLSMYADHHTVVKALDAGAIGYVLKGCGAVELVEAIRSVAAGRGHLSSGVTGGVIRDLLTHRAADTAEPSLTARERTVLQLIAEGHRSAEIAAHLGISVKTVSSHRENVMAKLDLHSVAELTKYAIRERITSLEFSREV